MKINMPKSILIGFNGLTKKLNDASRATAVFIRDNRPDKLDTLFVIATAVTLPFSPFGVSMGLGYFAYRLGRIGLKKESNFPIEDEQGLMHIAGSCFLWTTAIMFPLTYPDFRETFLTSPYQESTVSQECKTASMAHKIMLLWHPTSNHFCFIKKNNAIPLYPTAIIQGKQPIIKMPDPALGN